MRRKQVNGRRDGRMLNSGLCEIIQLYTRLFLTKDYSIVDSLRSSRLGCHLNRFHGACDSVCLVIRRLPKDKLRSNTSYVMIHVLVYCMQ